MNPSIRSDLRRALASNTYERTADGRIFLPRGAGLFIGGVFSTSVNGGDRRALPNDFVNEGLDDVLKVLFKQSSQRTAFYIAPFSGDVVVDPATLTAANFDSTMTEFTDYSEGARPAWTPDAEANQAVANAGSQAVFTINLDNSTIWGFALLTAQAKNATTGVLYCASKDATARSNLRSGDKLNVEYDITAQGA